MSSILKALRKIEEEKRVARPAAPDLRVDQGLRPVRAKQYRPLLVGVVLGAFIVGLFSFWLSGNADLVVKEASQPSESVPSTIPSRALPDKPTVKTANSEVSLSPVPKPVVRQRAVVTSQPVAKPEKKLPVVDLATQADMPTAVPIVPSPVVSAVLPEGVSLFVTEIFWQESNSDSMAVVNDLPVMVGTHVDSAVVDGIRKEQVIFKIDGKLYIVGLSSI
jgi:general secretion pathway protein B